MRDVSMWERVPRLELRVGGVRLPAWTTLGRTGAIAGAAVFAAGSATADLDILAIAAAIAANLCSFAAWAAIARRWRGGRYVLLEHAMLAAAATVLVATAIGAPAALMLDRWTIGLATCLAIGRLGCLLHGCCHGQPARRGLRYPWLPPWYLGSSWTALRLFPLQAVEAGVLASLAIAGAWLTHTPGLAASAIAVGYAVARFEIERRRGDARRYIGPLSHNQWWCIAIAMFVLVFGHLALAASGLVAISLLTLGRLGRLAAPPALSSPRALAELTAAVARARAGEAARVGKIIVEPASLGIRIRPGATSLSAAAARAIEAAVAGRR